MEIPGKSMKIGFIHGAQFGEALIHSDSFVKLQAGLGEVLTQSLQQWGRQTLLLFLPGRGVRRQLRK